jgi:hypothetical protein
MSGNDSIIGEGGQVPVRWSRFFGFSQLRISA